MDNLKVSLEHPLIDKASADGSEGVLFSALEVSCSLFECVNNVS